MNKKKLYMLYSSVKSNKGGVAIIGIMILFALVCCNITAVCVGEYYNVALFFSNPNTQNAVQIFVADDSYDTESLLSLEGTDFAFKVSSYNCNLKYGEVSCLYAATKELFNADNGFFGSNICNEMTQSRDKIKLLAFGESGFQKGDTGTLDNGKPYVIADVISDSSLQMVIGLIRFKSFLLAYDDDNGSFDGLTNFTFPVIYEKLSNNISFEEWNAANQNEASYSINEINSHEIMSSEFSSSFSMSIIGFTVFIAAAIGIIINSYLIFDKNKKDYRALSVIGMRRSTLLSQYITEKIVLLVLALIIAFFALVLISNILDMELITVLSAVISALAVIAILTICTLIYNSHLKSFYRRSL